MRLLRVDDDGEFSLVEFVGRHVPPYAVLSHTWGADSEEVTFNDLMGGAAKTKTGYRKIQFCGKHAANDQLEYFWVDTCCIDKSSSAEISEAVNSMFRWYHNAARCYVYLSDVWASGSIGSDSTSQRTWGHAFRQSRWFTRGWTLQELLAPSLVEFFSAGGERLGDKSSLARVIHDITGISVEALGGRPLTEFSVDERMFWAETRQTKREEDAAYCLLGIFDIYIPLIYGEGRDRAFTRLQREISASLDGTPATASNKNAQNSMAIPIWPGHFTHARLSAVYLQQRDMMSDAAYFGRWDEVMELLEVAGYVYRENWSNTIRLRQSPGSDELSFWTPLHQAAYLGAPLNVVKCLIASGSSRTLRTRNIGTTARESFEANDLTAVEIARGMHHSHLCDVLAPVIRHPLPRTTLERLQALFHAMIRVDLGEEVSNLVLPELESLTELRVPDMWFPTARMGGKENAVGYRYRLDNRDLVVVKLGIGRTSPSTHRISGDVAVEGRSGPF